MSLLINKLELADKVENITSQMAELQNEIQSLKERLDIYEVAASGANDGLWDWDFIADKPFVSKPWKTMLGIGENEEVEMVGLWESLLHPEDKEQATNYFKEFIKGNDLQYRQEFRMRHSNGSYRWILSKATALRNESGKVTRISGSHTDITERKLAADALKLSEEKYKSLFENSLVGMFRSDFSTGKIIESNDKFWQILGGKRLENVSTIDFYKSPSDREFVLGLVKETGKAENIELEIKQIDGTPIWVSFSIKHYTKENVLETILVDITETKNNLLELQKVNFELDSFVYHASHDLRSPLRSILGLIDLYRLEDSDKVKEQCIERIEGSVKRLDDLVQELLSISRNDRVNDPHQEINLMSEINNSIASYFNATNTENLQIFTNVRHKHKFKSDATRVRIILNNVISNAIKYRSFERAESIIKIDVKVSMEEAVITVEDNGEGIEESKLPHIFDMFYRATEKSVGSGLGLYIVKKVADKLNATIVVESEELEGTTFKIVIPNTAYNSED